MVKLDGAWEYLGIFALAAGLGALGGLAYELMQARRGHTGLLKVPRDTQRGRYIDLGVFSNIFIGAVAAVAALWVFPPEVKTVVDSAGKTVTTTQYDIFKVVGLSLIIGSAGSSFLTAMQARALALVKTQEAQQTRRVAQKQLEGVKTAVEAGAPKAQVAAKLESASAAVASTAESGTGNPVL